MVDEDLGEDISGTSVTSVPLTTLAEGSVPVSREGVLLS